MQLVFLACGLALVWLAGQVLWHGVIDVGMTQSARFDAILRTIGHVTIGVAALELGQTVLEEEVLRSTHVSGPTRARRFLSRFLVVVVVALAVESRSIGKPAARDGLGLRDRTREPDHRERSTVERATEHMNRTAMSRVAPLLCLLVASAAWPAVILGQSPRGVPSLSLPDAPQERPQASQPSFTVEVTRVEVSVLVLDAAGKPVTGLSAADFEVLEEGVPQQVRSFVPFTHTPNRLVLPEPVLPPAPGGSAQTTSHLRRPTTSRRSLACSS